MSHPPCSTPATLLSGNGKGALVPRYHLPVESYNRLSAFVPCSKISPGSPSFCATKRPASTGRFKKCMGIVSAIENTNGWTRTNTTSKLSAASLMRLPFAPRWNDNDCSLHALSLPTQPFGDSNPAARYQIGTGGIEPPQRALPVTSAIDDIFRSLTVSMLFVCKGDTVGARTSHQAVTPGSRERRIK